jgi:hypothetical protein
MVGAAFTRRVTPGIGRTARSFKPSTTARCGQLPSLGSYHAPAAAQAAAPPGASAGRGQCAARRGRMRDNGAADGARAGSARRLAAPAFLVQASPRRRVRCQRSTTRLLAASST